jgi:hypothetical protein
MIRFARLTRPPASPFGPPAVVWLPAPSGAALRAVRPLPDRRFRSSPFAPFGLQDFKTKQDWAVCRTLPPQNRPEDFAAG